MKFVIELIPTCTPSTAVEFPAWVRKYCPTFTAPRVITLAEISTAEQIANFERRATDCHKSPRFSPVAGYTYPTRNANFSGTLQQVKCAFDAYLPTVGDENVPLSSRNPKGTVALIGPGNKGLEVLELLRVFPCIEKLLIVDVVPGVMADCDQALQELAARGQKIPKVEGYLVDILQWNPPRQLQRTVDLCIDSHVFDREYFGADYLTTINRTLAQITKTTGLHCSCVAGAGGIGRTMMTAWPSRNVGHHFDTGTLKSFLGGARLEPVYFWREG